MSRDTRSAIAGRLAAVPVFALSVAAALLSFQLGLGQLRAPGPGMWPFIVAVMMALAAAALIISGDAGAADAGRPRWLLVVIAIVSLIAYIMAFTLIGFMVPTLLMLAFWLRLIAKESWRVTICLSIALTTAFYYIFAVLLAVPFPAGPTLFPTG